MRWLLFVIALAIIWLPVFGYLIFYSTRVLKKSAKYTEQYEKSLATLIFGIKMIACDVLTLIVATFLLWQESIH